MTDVENRARFRLGARHICEAAIVSAIRAMDRFPQPNYVAAKLAEESGEVVRAYIHMAEGRGSREDMEGEVIQLIGLALRLLFEGDETILANVAKFQKDGEK